MYKTKHTVTTEQTKVSANEWITEHSVKYSPAAATELVQQAGWRIQQRWHDADDHLSLHLLLPAD